LYWHAIRKLMVPERRHFLHETSLTDIIRIKLLEKEMITMPVTPEHNALIERIFTAWTETSYGFTFGRDAPAPRQPPTPPPPPGASPEQTALHERDWHLGADKDAYMTTLFARYETLDDVSGGPNNDDRKMVLAIQNIYPKESVARCMEALVRKEKDVPEVITWLGRTARK
jgi:hypothetical protein